MKPGLVCVAVVCSAILAGALGQQRLHAGCSDARYMEAAKLYRQALAANSPADKIELFERAFKTCPQHGNFSQGYYSLGKLYYEKNGKDKALEWLLEANRFRARLLEESSDDLAQTNLLLGNLFRERGDSERSLIHLNIYRALTQHRNKKLEDDLIGNAEAFFSVIYSPGSVKEVLAVDKAVARENRPKVNRLEVYFDFAKAILDEDAKKRLDSIGQGLKDGHFSGCTIVVEGHTDQSGGEKLNCDLGLKRAEAVKAHLQKEWGIDKVRLVVMSFGKSTPTISRTNHGNARWPTIDRFNRRVVIWNGGTPDQGEKDLTVESISKSPCSTR